MSIALTALMSIVSQRFFRNDKQISLVYCKTDDMAADIFTKPFHNATKWIPALSNINMIDTGPLNLIKTNGTKNIVKQ